MLSKFKHIALFTKPEGSGIDECLIEVYQYFTTQGINPQVDQIGASKLAAAGIQVAPRDKLGADCDLAIVIGGDGSLLKAARAIVNHGIPLLGINRGNLGFLSALQSDDVVKDLAQILAGRYHAERRAMLLATIVQGSNGDSQPIEHLALNDVVLHHGDIARLIEFEIFIDDKFVVKQRADGVLISTPTGSTAYALSGGGPIVCPTLNVLTLLPMFPHALNTRPLVIDKRSKIRLVISKSNKINAKFSCDGQTHMSLDAGDEVHIVANQQDLMLLQPESYNYYNVLRQKLGWNTELV